MRKQFLLQRGLAPQHYSDLSALLRSLCFGLGLLAGALCLPPALSQPLQFASQSTALDPQGQETFQKMQAVYQPFVEHLEALVSTAVQWEKKGDYGRALQITQQALRYGLNKQVRAKAQKEFQSLTGSQDPSSELQGWMDSRTDDVRVYLGHLLCITGQYRKALDQFETVWSDTQRSSPNMLKYRLSPGLTSMPIMLYELEAALCYYRLGAYAKAMQLYCVAMQHGGFLDVYGKRMQEHPELVGPKELGGVILMRESSNVMGEREWLLIGLPDPRYTFNWDLALKYAEEAYKLLPNSLDVCQQYCMLLCLFKQYPKAAEVYAHMIALYNRGPSAYQCDASNPRIAYFWVDYPNDFLDYLQEWKKTHPGQLDMKVSDSQ